MIRWTTPPALPMPFRLGVKKGLSKKRPNSGSEAGSYLRLIDFVYHSTLALRVIKKKRTRPERGRG